MAGLLSKELLIRGEPGSSSDPGPKPKDPSPATGPATRAKPRRFYGSVELDMVRPVKVFDAILNAVVMELQRTHGAKVKLTIEIEIEAEDGFADSEVSVVRDNAGNLSSKLSRRALKIDHVYGLKRTPMTHASEGKALQPIDSLSSPKSHAD